MMLLFSGGGLRASQSMLAIATTVVAVGATRGLISGDRVQERWVILFQRPDPPHLHYARVLALTAGVVGVLLAVSAIGLAIAADIPTALAAWSGAVLWAVVCMATATGISSLVRRFDLEITLLLIAASLGQGYLLPIVGVSGAAASITSYMLLPIDGVFMLWGWLLETGALPPPGRIVHTLAYPMAWLAVAAWRLTGPRGRYATD
jgi:hypothetical protein